MCQYARTGKRSMSNVVDTRKGVVKVRIVADDMAVKPKNTRALSADELMRVQKRTKQLMELRRPDGKRRWTGEALGEKLEISQQSVSRIAAGESCGYLYVRRLAALDGMTADVLLTAPQELLDIVRANEGVYSPAAVAAVAALPEAKHADADGFLVLLEEMNRSIRSGRKSAAAKIKSRT